jgi:hypothetical protein
MPIIPDLKKLDCFSSNLGPQSRTCNRMPFALVTPPLAPLFPFAMLTHQYYLTFYLRSGINRYYAAGRGDIASLEVGPWG